MSFTLNYIALLLVVLLIGLILGLMISGRGKYKRLWRDEREAHKDTIRDRDARIEAANARIADMGRPSPISSGTAAAVAGGARGRDDLSMIRGIGSQDEVVLNETGYHRYDQIAALSDEEQATLEGRLGRAPASITREDWREQARLLDAGKVDEHSRRFGR